MVNYLKKAFFVISVSLLFISVFSVSVRAGLDKSYTTPEGNFTINYSDDFVRELRNATTLLQVQQFGSLLEDVRSRFLGYGFNDPGDLIANVYDKGTSVRAASAGARSMHFDPFYLGNPSKGNVSNTGNLSIVSHEVFHSVQFNSAPGPYPRWIMEGQAEMMRDKIYASVDVVNASQSKYVGEVNGYLKTTDQWSLFDRGYTASLFWTYVTEKYGSISTEPDLGIDAVVEFWNAAQSLGGLVDPIAVFDQMLDNLGYESVTLDEVFQDFAVANFAKKLSGPDVPSKYKYQDETQSPGPYNNVTHTLEEELNAGDVIAGTDSVKGFSADYFSIKPHVDTGSVITVEVNQITDDELFFDLLIIRDDNIIDEYRITGTDFVRSITTEADELVLIVVGLQDSLSDSAKYHYSFSEGGAGLSVNILSPLSAFTGSVSRAFAGDPSNPEKFSAIVEVLSSATPVRGLDKEDFKVLVGTDNASILTAYDIFGIYFLEIQAPNKTVPGLYDLTVNVSRISDLEPNSVLYGSQRHDTVITIDKSWSMERSPIDSTPNDKIDAAQAAARIFVNSFLQDNQMGLVQFEADANLLMGLQEVSLSRTNILTLIDNITADGGSTSIGDGLLAAQNELFTNGDPMHLKHIILLTDGKENAEQLINDVDGFLDSSPNSTILHVVLIGRDAEENRLDVIAQRTGGLMFPAFDPDSGASSFARMSLTHPNIGYSLASDPLLGSLTSNLADIYRRIAGFQSGEERIFSSKKEILGSGGWNIAEQFEMDKARAATVAFNYKANHSLSGSGISLKLPNGTSLNPLFESEKSGFNFPSNYYGHFVWKLQNPDEGTYSVMLTGFDDIEYFLETSVNGYISSNIGVHFLDLSSLGPQPASPASIIVTLADDNPIHEANVIANIRTGKGLINTQTWTLHLYDDGAHGDGLANDGVYGNTFTRTSSEGPYVVTAYVNGFSETAGKFTRELSSTFYLRGNPDSLDSDSDGLPDIWESRYGLDPLDGSGENGTDGDPDFDKLKNFEELISGTDPKKADTDNGGESDYSEIKNNRDPYYDGDDNIGAPSLLLTPGDGRIDINFTIQGNYNHLRLYRAVSSSDYIPLASDYAQISTVGVSTNTYADIGLTNTHTYFYKMVGVSDFNEESKFSSVVSAKPNSDVNPPNGVVLINNDDLFTNSLDVVLRIDADEDTEDMRISQDPSFSGVSWIPYTHTLPFTLGGVGVQWIYAQFRDAHGNIGGFDYKDSEFDAIFVDTSIILPATTVGSSSTAILSSSLSSSLALTTANWNVVFSIIPLFALGIELFYRRKVKK